MLVRPLPDTRGSGIVTDQREGDMVEHDDLDAVLAACPSCDGLGLQLDSCPEAHVDDLDACHRCEAGNSPSLCRYCDATGMVCAQVVISVVNVDLATVASTQVVAGAHPPRRLVDGGWGFDCRAIAAELAGEVSVYGTGDADEIIPLPREYHPDLPVDDRHELEAAAIATAAQRSRWRIRQAFPISASLTKRAQTSNCDCLGGQTPAKADTCHNCHGLDTGHGASITLAQPTRSSSPRVRPWTLDHLAQIGFGLGLRLDITCRMSTADGVDDPVWTMTWSPTGTVVTPAAPDGVTDFDEAVRLAAGRLNEAPNSMFSRGELIPVPRQTVPPIVGVRRAKAVLVALARQGSCDAVLCQLSAGNCSISLCTGRYVELVSRGSDLEAAATGIGL